MRRNGLHNSIDNEVGKDNDTLPNGIMVMDGHVGQNQTSLRLPLYMVFLQDEV